MILWNATAKLFTASLRQPSKEPFRSPMNNYWMTNNELQRTAASHHCCNRRVLWPPSLSLGSLDG
jgi:hypothetical protein